MQMHRTVDWLVSTVVGNMYENSVKVTLSNDKELKRIVDGAKKKYHIKILKIIYARSMYVFHWSLPNF